MELVQDTTGETELRNNLEKLGMFVIFFLPLENIWETFKYKISLKASGNYCPPHQLLRKVQK